MTTRRPATTPARPRRRALLLGLGLGLGAGLALGPLAAAPASAQCILANPSFEIGAAGAQVFGGWNQFGDVGSTGDAHHGSAAARVRGPDAGGWDVSGFWQDKDTAAGERWEVTGHVRHPAGAPLAGQSAALVNVEWRDAAGDLISYDTFAVADAGSPADVFLDFAVLSGPAPAGAVTARLLLGVLQGPADPVPDVHFDQVTFHGTTPPTIDDVQWNDFPGGRTLEFAGRTWRVKGPGWYGPGPSAFCDLPECVWVDAQDRLHLTISDRGGAWASTEVVLEEPLGYGDYVFTTEGDLDALDPHAVLGLFIWQYGPCYDVEYLWWNPYNEIDVEISRWGDPGNDVGQFVAQPYDWSGNLERFAVDFAPGETVSFAFAWRPDRVEFRAWRGGPADESPQTTVHAWTYAGPHIPRPEQPRVHMNLWQFDGPPASHQEVVVSGFAFVPLGATAADGAVAGPPAPAGRLRPAAPNPFNPETVLAFELDRPAAVRLDIHALDGRRVRTLAAAPLGAGEHRRTWNGRDDAGRPLPSGVYLVRLQGPDFLETRRVALVR